MNPHLLGRPAVVSFSGGRTSGCMPWHILQAFGGTPPDDVARDTDRWREWCWSRVKPTK